MVFRLRTCLVDGSPTRNVITRKGISRAIKTVYYRPGRSVFAGLPKARAVIGVLALGCFVTGFITAWVLRTGFVMTQISWAQERMERKVRYWQGEAIHARAAAEPALRDPRCASPRHLRRGRRQGDRRAVIGRAS
jgi:hypothetical protein